MWVVMHDGTLGERAVPDGRGGVVFAVPGVPFEVDDEVAGYPPGVWEPCAGDVSRDEEGADVSGDYAHEPLAEPVQLEDGTSVAWRRRHLGRGLLAQEDVFRAAGPGEVDEPAAPVDSTGGEQA